ncbi:multiprotein-bridging factor 1 family protein [Actinomadura yumaensis]|uniref:helix-turn-helix domain-containing protein n=1 Tax=Actinomadura yumaensis TaxID=111807 RepID=UPI00361D7C1A
MVATRNGTSKAAEHTSFGGERLQRGGPHGLAKADPQTITFGAEVARLREEAGLSRIELAKRANVSRSYIGQVETGTTRCRDDFAIRLDQALGTGTQLIDAWTDLLRSAAYPPGSPTTPAPRTPPRSSAPTR